MSMFDWYRPTNSLSCPFCHTPLTNWQGKDGPCALYIWQQGIAAPTDQDCDEACRGSADVMAASRLPDSFTIFSDDCRQHLVFASCRSVSGVWTETHLEPTVSNLTPECC